MKMSAVKFKRRTRLKRPLFLSAVPAGFPSPADDYVERALDLNAHLIKHPAATFFVRVRGDSMIGAGIRSGDLLIIDRSLEAGDGRVVIAALDGELTVKRLHRTPKGLRLEAENPAFSRPIEIPAEAGFEVWGVVTHVIHAC